MSAVVHRRGTCRLCGGQHLELVLQLAPAPLVDAYVSAARLGEVQVTYPLDLFLCNDCSHVQLLDVIEPEVLYADYIYATSSSPGLVEHFQRYATEVLDRARAPEGALVVDIGSNDGTLLRFFQDRGMIILGVDPARDIAREATSSGIETLPSFFTYELAHNIRKERGPAAIITANNVFAHADDLGDMADGVAHLLAVDGVFTFEVSYLVDMLQNMVFDFIYHEHLCYHSVRPLQAFLYSHGMELIDIKRIPTKGGSVRGVAQLTTGSRQVSPSVGEITDLESRLAIHRAEPFRTFAAQIDALKIQLGSMLRDLNRKGKTIAGYGASATVTTLIYHFDLGDMLSFIVDDNPSRQNLFSPGHHIPVLSPDTIYERKPDYVLILAWRYSKPIIAKHQAFLDQGGHFIVPLPKIEVT